MLFNLESTAVNSLSDTPSVVVLAERVGGRAGADSTATKAARGAMVTALARVAREWRDEGAREVLFFRSFEARGRVTRQVREQLGLGRPTDVPDVVLVDSYSHYSYNAYCEMYRVVAEPGAVEPAAATQKPYSVMPFITRRRISVTIVPLRKLCLLSVSGNIGFFCPPSKWSQ